MEKYKYLTNPNSTSVLMVYKRLGNVPLAMEDTKAKAVKKANKLYHLNKNITIIPKYSYGEKRPYRYEIFGKIRETKTVTKKVGYNKVIKTMIKTPRGWERLSTSTYKGFYKKKRK